MRSSKRLKQIIRRSGIETRSADDNLLGYMKLLIEMDKVVNVAEKESRNATE
jgi:hypothetical protein